MVGPALCMVRARRTGPLALMPQMIPPPRAHHKRRKGPTGDQDRWIPNVYFKSERSLIHRLHATATPYNRPPGRENITKTCSSSLGRVFAPRLGGVLTTLVRSVLRVVPQVMRELETL